MAHCRTTSLPRVISYQLIIGIGLDMLLQPSLIALQKQLRRTDIAAGTSAFLFIRSLSNGISACVGQLLLQSQMKTQHSEMLEAGISPEIAGTLVFEDTVKGTPLIKGLTGEQQAVVKGIIEKSLEEVWIFYTAVAFIALLASFCITKAKKGGDEKQEAATCSRDQEASEERDPKNEKR